MMAKFKFRSCEFASFAALAILVAAGCNSAPVHLSGSAVREAEKSIEPARAAARFSEEGTRSGGIARLDVLVPRAFTSSEAGVVLEAKAFGRSLHFYPVKSSRDDLLEFSALIAVPFEEKPGDRVISVRVRRLDQESMVLDSRLKVLAADYPSETLSVDPRHVKPDSQAIKRILREKAILGKIYRGSVREKLWDGPFQHPVSNPPSSEFGIRRIYNGQMQSYHQGKDYRAPIGTGVLAAGAGRVAFAGDLYMTGNTVILDHGWGLFTIYAHLSALTVTEGRLVPRGALLGLSGMTGRASGPHLHFGVNLNRLKVDPNDLLQISR